MQQLSLIDAELKSLTTKVPMNKRFRDKLQERFAKRATNTHVQLELLKYLEEAVAKYASFKKQRARAVHLTNNFLFVLVRLMGDVPCWNGQGGVRAASESNCRLSQAVSFIGARNVVRQRSTRSGLWIWSTTYRAAERCQESARTRTIRSSFWDNTIAALRLRLSGAAAHPPKYLRVHLFPAKNEILTI